MRPRHNSWRIAVAVMLGAAATLGSAIDLAHSHRAMADPAPANNAPTPPPAPGPPPAPTQGRPGPPPPPIPQYTPPVKHGPAPPGVAATVNGTVISTNEVKDEAYQRYGPMVVKNLILQTLVEQEAQKNHVVPTEAQINAQIADDEQRIAQQMPGKTLADQLSMSGTTMDQYKKYVLLNLEAENLVSSQFKPGSLVHVEHLLVSTQAMGGPNSKPAHTDADAQAIIAKAQADLKAGKAWKDVVAEYSEDPSNKNTAGDLGILTPNSPMDPAFLQAALALKAGQTSQPVKSQFGYHIIYCVSTSDNVPTAEQAQYAQAEKQYKDSQMRQLVPTYVQGLQQKANIVNYLQP